MLYKSLDPSLFALIVDASKLPEAVCAVALDTVLEDFEDDREALTFIYQLGTIEVGLRCQEINVCLSIKPTEVCLYEMNCGQLIAVCKNRAFLDMQCSEADFSTDAEAILYDLVSGWSMPVELAADVAADLAHPETRFIATFSLPGGLALTESMPGSNGLAYLGDCLLELAGWRVRNSVDLEEAAEYIMADWPEGGAHWWWVATAAEAEILAWVRAGQQ